MTEKRKEKKWGGGDNRIMMQIVTTNCLKGDLLQRRPLLPICIRVKLRKIWNVDIFEIFAPTLTIAKTVP